MTLPAFDEGQKNQARKFLAARVASMAGRKLEEGDWSFVYCAAKRIPHTGWSNVHIDVSYQGLGVEHKMLRRTKGGSILEMCGTSAMHPAATRSIRIEGLSTDADEAAIQILGQYQHLIDYRTKKVREASGNGTADMRFGWLIWKDLLDEFLYFEEPMAISLDFADLRADWNETPIRGSRKATRSLWIYERSSGKKKYSVTTTAGAKIQPYFDIPLPDDPNLCHFVVQGNEVGGLIELWIERSTASYLRQVLGSLDEEALSNAIMGIEKIEDDATTVAGDGFVRPEDLAEPVRITKEAYARLRTVFSSIHDAQLMNEFASALG